MHRLELRAFRSELPTYSLRAPGDRRNTSFTARCFPLCAPTQQSVRQGLNAPSGAQCFPTESVEYIRHTPEPSCLNAPSGAQCFPTLSARPCGQRVRRVSMHRLVLSAFRPVVPDITKFKLSVSMHLLVLSAFRLKAWSRSGQASLFQCTFWCSVLSDGKNWFRKSLGWMFQCTFWCSVLSDYRRNEEWHSVHSIRLNAPSGAQCFPTRPQHNQQALRLRVSMHLLVLSAFRRARHHFLSGGGRQVSMHLLVLSAFRQKGQLAHLVEFAESQCTFWCSVLSDWKLFKSRCRT